MQPDLESPAALARLLRELPVQGELPYDYAEFQRRAQRSARNGRGQAAAACAVLALAVIALSLRLGAPAPHIATDAAPPGGAGPAADGAPPEHERAFFPREPAVARLGTRVAVTTLEDRIAQLDDLLSDARASHDAAPQLQALQQERTRLFGTLLQVRYAETLNDESL